MITCLRVKFFHLAASIFFSLAFISTLFASNLEEDQATHAINKLYHSLNQIPNMTMATRLDQISAYFLGQPYELGALGEGEKAYFDQAPAYRVNAFDCETYVTTVIALALSKNVSTFEQCLQSIRYRPRTKVDFTMRNHFTSIDWNKNNQKQGFIKDITTTIRDQKNKTLAVTSTTWINKPAWYRHLSETSIRLNNKDELERSKRLKRLQSSATKFKKERSVLAYLPLTALFNEKGEPNQALFAQIPHGAIIEIVRPNWDLEKAIGTKLDISHLGFAFWKKGNLIFREASSVYHEVVDVPLIGYLQKARESTTIKGINVQVVLPKMPLSSC